MTFQGRPAALPLICLLLAAGWLPAQTRETRIDISEEHYGKDAGKFAEAWPVYLWEKSPEARVGDPDTKVIYGTDDRIDWYEETHPERLDLARSTCALVGVGDIIDNNNGTWTLNSSLVSGFGRPYCESEPFHDQPAPGFCSGFLVAADLVATAGHCIDSTGEAQGTHFVFSFHMTDESTPRLLVNDEDVYKGMELAGRVLNTSTGEDWSLVRLERPVTGPGAIPLTIRRTGVIANTTPVGVIGHPAGLPSKIAWGDTTAVRDNSPGTFFEANLDTYGGNSGSAVFNQVTRVVEGILVRGETDYVVNGSCVVSNVVSDDGGSGEDVTKTTNGGFMSLIPLASPSGPPPVDDSTGGDGDGMIEPGEALITIQFPVRNTSEGSIVNPTATLSSPTPGVTIGGAAATYPVLAAGSTAPGSPPFVFSLSGDHSCGDPITLDFELSIPGGDTRTYSYILPTGPVCDFSPTFTVGAPVVDDTAGNGNSNGVAEPGETMINLDIPITNDGTAATQVMGTLVSMTPTVEVVTDGAMWPDIGMGSTESNTTPFVIGIAPEHVCGAPANFQLTLDHSGGSSTLPVTVTTGVVVPETFSENIPAPVDIVDNTTVTAVIDVPVHGTVTDVDVTLNVQHSYLGDLLIELTGPNGQVSTLFARRGGSGQDLTATILSDEAAQPISAGTPSFTGTWRPETPLSIFDGRQINGPWTLSVTDNATQDTGVILIETGLTIEYDGGVCDRSDAFWVVR